MSTCAGAGVLAALALTLRASLHPHTLGTFDSENGIGRWHGLCVVIVSEDISPDTICKGAGQ